MLICIRGNRRTRQLNILPSLDSVKVKRFSRRANITLTGSSKGKVVRQSLINPDWDFSQMGIGGLDNQFNAIFRRAFASRVFPPEIIEQLSKCSVNAHFE